jgi:hypothetical protein
VLYYITGNGTNEMTESSVHQPIRSQEKRTNQKGGYKKKQQSTPSIQSLHSIKSRDKRAETHTSFDMSRFKSKSIDQAKALNIPFTMTQGDLVQEASAVTFAKDQTQALNIPVKVPLGGGRYAELTEWNGTSEESGSEILGKRYDSYQVCCQLVFVTVESLVQCYASGGRFDQSSERRRTCGLGISSGRRRLLHHQSPSTDNSHQEVLCA